MTNFIDLEVRKSLDNYLLTIGEAAPDDINKKLDLIKFETEFAYAEIYLSVGEMSDVSSMPKDKDWIEYFLVKSPRSFMNESIEKKHYQYGVWIKTKPENGLGYNEMVSSLIEEHFSLNTIFNLKNNNTLNISRVHQNASISVDKRTGRVFNRVFVDCTATINHP